MMIRVNGAERQTCAQTLAGLLAECDYGDAIVATAQNQIFIRAKDRASTMLEEGDEIEILTPRQGG